MKIGIIGVGMVGGAMLKTFREKGLTVIAYDKFKPGFDDKAIHFEAFDECDFVFVSVPTLTKDSGVQDLEPLEDVLLRLKQLQFKGIVVSKCTTLPGTTRRFKSYYGLRLLHWPEFLRAATAYDDFRFQTSALISGYDRDCLELAEFLRELFPRLSIRLFASHAATEIAKYTHNCFLATKISFLNEIFEACQIYNVSYEEVISGVSLLGRIGEQDLRVPGPDGNRGWGGFCFPKDTKAWAHFMEPQGVPCDTLKGAIETNKKVRK